MNYDCRVYYSGTVNKLAKLLHGPPWLEKPTITGEQIGYESQDGSFSDRRDALWQAFWVSKPAADLLDESPEARA